MFEILGKEGVERDASIFVRLEFCRNLDGLCMRVQIQNGKFARVFGGDSLNLHGPRYMTLHN